MKALHLHKEGNPNERRVYVVPEDGWEAGDFLFYGGNVERVPKEMIDCIYDDGKKQIHGKALAFRFTESKAWRDTMLTAFIEDGLRKGVDLNARHPEEYNTRNFKIVYASPIDAKPKSEDGARKAAHIHPGIEKQL